MPLLVLLSTDTFHNTLYWSSGSLSTANHEAPVKPADPFAESLVLVALLHLLVTPVSATC